MADPKTLYVKPARPDLVVRDPRTKNKLPAETGTRVPRTSYWRRRLAKGDVVETRAPAKPKAAAKPAEKES